MTPQEKELISTLLTRLQAAATQVKDPEADAMIRQALVQQPDAPYFLVQTVLIQDLSLHNAQSRIAELESQIQQAKLAPPAPAPTSFLGSLFGHHDPAPQQAASVPPAGPWSRGPQTVPPQQGYAQPGYPQQGYAQPGYAQQGYPPAGGGMLGGGLGGGGGFLRSAAATAAGVAGGALLFEGIQSMFGHSYANSLGGVQAGMTPGLGETVINNYYPDAGSGPGDYGSAGYDAGSGGGQDFSGGDFGGGDQGGFGNASDSGGDFGGGDSGGDFGSSSC